MLDRRWPYSLAVPCDPWAFLSHCTSDPWCVCCVCGFRLPLTSASGIALCVVCALANANSLYEFAARDAINDRNGCTQGIIIRVVANYVRAHKCTFTSWLWSTRKMPNGHSMIALWWYTLVHNNNNNSHWGEIFQCFFIQLVLFMCPYFSAIIYLCVLFFDITAMRQNSTRARVKQQFFSFQQNI